MIDRKIDVHIPMRIASYEAWHISLSVDGLKLHRWEMGDWEGMDGAWVEAEDTGVRIEVLNLLERSPIFRARAERSGGVEIKIRSTREVILQLDD